MSNEQKLREALCELMHIVSIHQRATRNNFAWAEMAFAREALALPTADHIPDAGGMVVDHFPDATKMIETAAPVGEHEAFERTMMDKYGWQRNDFKLDDFGYFDGHTDTAWMAWQARAALSAGDAGWQPIETAPKDGSDCWLLVEEEVRRGFWVEIEFEERRDLDGRYIDQTDDYAYWMDKDSGDSIEPTMFYPITKPLPPAPAMRKDKP